MPSTRGTNFYLADRNLERLCAAVMDRETFARARPHLVAMGEVAGGELDALAHDADKNPPVLRRWDERGQRVDEVLLPSVVPADGGAGLRSLRAGRHVPSAGRAGLARARCPTW